jgi:hypothetical protein
MGEAVGQWQSGALSWAEAGAAYQQQVMEATHPVFLSNLSSG